MRPTPLQLALIITTASIVPGFAIIGQGSTSPNAIPTSSATENAAQEKRLSFTARDIRIRDALMQISSKTGITVSWNDELPFDRRVTVSLQNVTVVEALRAVLKDIDADLTFSNNGHTVSIKPTGVSASSAKSKSTVGGVSGRVVDSATGKGLGGVTVLVNGTKLSVTTDNDGLFTLRGISVGTHVLTVRQIGYMSATYNIAIVEGTQIAVRITLAPASTQLAGVVTTATGVQRRVEIGNSVTRLDVDEIRKTAPITSVTDLLVARVPGLVDLKSTGAPGDPTRIRLRGTSSVTRNNDPIVIVDGVRMYAAQSDARNGNLISTSKLNDNSFGNIANNSIPAPSPLDQIDPNSVETIEVFNGPSATTMYGSDAANGVIVITTKKGKAGPTRWSLDVYRGTSTLRTQYPDRSLGWGRAYWNNEPIACILSDPTCIIDSVIKFNSAAQSRLSPFGRGVSTGVSATVSGGSQALRYNLTGSYDDDLGLLKLPAVSAEQYRLGQGADAPGWMKRPATYKTNRGTMQLTWQPSPTLTFLYTGNLTHARQTRSSLEDAVAERISHIYANPTDSTFYELSESEGKISSGGSPLYLSEFYKQISAERLQTLQNFSGNWQPRPWLMLAGDAGVDVQHREDRGVLRRGFTFDNDSLGYADVGQANTNMRTVNARASIQSGSMFGISVTPTVGFNYVVTSTSDILASARELIEGTSSMSGAKEYQSVDNITSQATFGGYLQTAFNLWNRFYLSPAIRWDGGNTFGSDAKVFAMPKLSTSWLASDESFFPFKSTVDAFRIRVAYGQAGRQPGITDRLRLYSPTSVWLDGKYDQSLNIVSFGNTQLRPERSIETEGGFDLDMFDTRLSLAMTWYNKITRDMLLNVQVAPSVLGGTLQEVNNIATNIGRVQNKGVELSAIVTPVRTRAFEWTSSLTYAQNRNTLLKLGSAGAHVYTAFTSPQGGPRYIEGYPLAGFWARPIVSFADANTNGVIDTSEVQIGDSSVYMGPPYPKYTAGLVNTVSLMNGTLTISGQLAYTRGATQTNYLLWGNRFLTPALTDKATPIATQAAYVAMAKTAYGVTQSVSTLRFNSMSINYILPNTFAKRVRAQTMTVSLQGSNLGVRSNYSGLDPNINGFSGEVEGVGDFGMMPEPRMWRLAARFTY